MTRAATSSPLTNSGRSSWRVSLALFLVALGARLLFLYSGPDARWPYSLHYKGDALVWLQSVLARRGPLPFEGGVPLRPPGMVWLVDALWDGTEAGIMRLKLVWVAMGALSVLVLHRALLRSFSRVVAATAAGLAALASGGLILSTSLGNETPYLVLFLLTMLVQPERGEHASRRRLLLWGLLHAGATLVRVEHVLFFALVVAYRALGWWRRLGPRAALRATGLVAAAFALLLLPWQVSLSAAIERFNQGQGARDPAADRALATFESRLEHIVWQPEARAAARTLPAFTRRSARAFVTATVQHRGGGVVGPEDLGVIEEAFGSRPEPLAGYPFVASYGALNFYLANNVRASAGFSRAALEVAPHLAGGAERYPPELVESMPPARFSFEYPPHLAMFNDGYRLGREWILEDPAAWAGLVLAKVGVFWRGASLGFTGHGFPVGSSGVRRAVDLVTPRGMGAILWRWLVLAGCIAGLVAAYGAGSATGERGALLPWLLYGATKVLVVAAFFGYARHGVLISPLVQLLWALALARWLVPPLGRRAVRLGIILLPLGLVVEAVRCVRGVRAEVDGVPVGEIDPMPADVHADRQIRFFSGVRLDQK